MMKKAFLILLILTVSLRALWAQGGTVTISGYVKDASSGEALVGAMVFTSDKKTGAASNGFGYYTISVKSGEHDIVCSNVGYVDKTVHVDCRKGSLTLDFEMSEDREMLESAVVYSRTKKDVLTLPQMGVQTVDVAMVKKLPALMGETDIIRVIQMMPGVQSPSEGSTGFSVRGGGIDQNLILMDGAPVYNSGHFLGFLSMFNGDVVKNVQLYKGDFPAKYGSKMSSVLDVSTIDGNNNKFGGSASVGLLTSKLFINGPIAPGKASFVLAGRRSYLDMFFPLFKKVPEGTKLSFYDINAKISWVVNDNNRLHLSAFSSDDRFGFGLEELGVHNMYFDYKNNTQSLRWNHVFSPKLTSVLTLYNSRYTGSLECDMDDCPFIWQKNLNETGLRNNYSWHLGQNATLEFGAEAAYFFLNPSECHPNGESIVMDVVLPPSKAVSPAVYLEHEQKLGRLNLRYGLRFSSFTTMGETEQLYFDPKTHERTDSLHFGPGKAIKTHFGLDPRFSASLKLSDNASLKAAYTRTHQYVEQVALSAAGGVMDTWFCASPNVKPQISDQVSLGFNRNFFSDAVEFSTEAFYKYNQNTLDLKDNPGLVIIDMDSEGLLRFGTSYAYGVEVMARYEFPKVSGWVSYTWTKSMFNIPEINNGNPYRSPLNHEHAVNLVVTWDITKQWCASGTWLFYSGAPTTFPVERFKFGESYLPIYSARNEDSMPDYHRADISLTFKTRRRVEGKRWGSELNFSIYNLYGRHNAWTVSYGYNSKEDRMDAYKIYLFTIIPSVSYTINF
jgi:Outer membrane receptor for ferrienterochelin and colicins